MADARWKSRPIQSLLLRLVIVAVPIASSFGAASFLSNTLPRPQAVAATVMWWVAVLGGSLLVLLVAERLMRRLSPLAVLLKLSLAFPDQAPSRFRVARETGRVGELKRRLEELGRDGYEGEEAQVAEIVLALATALSSHDRHTRGHSERVRVFTDMLAEEMRISGEGRDRLRWAALLHDIGKLTVSAQILNKPGTLDDREWETIKRHPAEGMRFIGPLTPWLGEWATAIEHHHERYDGTGYPAGLAGHQISLGARIVSVADAYDTITAARSYKKPLSASAARAELAREAGSQFDPGVVRALLNISIGKLWRRVGIWSWLVQVPLIGRVPELVGRAAGLQEGAVVAAKSAALVTAIGAAGAALPPTLASGAAAEGRTTAVVTLTTKEQRDGTPSSDDRRGPAGKKRDPGEGGRGSTEGQSSEPGPPGTEPGTAGEQNDISDADSGGGSGGGGGGGSGNGGGQGGGSGGTPPGQGGTPPDQGGTPPGQGGTPPDQGGTPPGQGGTPPTPPGQGGTPPVDDDESDDDDDDDDEDDHDDDDDDDD